MNVTIVIGAVLDLLHASAGMGTPDPTVGTKLGNALAFFCFEIEEEANSAFAVLWKTVTNASVPVMTFATILIGRAQA